jgi:Calpain family cysteine protease
MVSKVSAVKKVKVKKVKAAKVKAPKKAKVKKSKGKVVQVIPPTPVAPPPPPLFSLPDQRVTSSGNQFNVSHYIEYYQAVNGKRQLLQSAVQNRANYNTLTPEQQAFLNKFGGPNSSSWFSNATLRINQEVRPFDLAERQRLKVPPGVPLDETTYQQALTGYNRIENKSLIGAVIEKFQNFSNALNNLIRSFGAAAGGVIQQLAQGLQNIMAAFFPQQLDTMDIQQGYVGNCYLLAGINALGENGDADTQAMLRDATQFNEDGSIKVSFAGLGVKDWDAQGNPVYTSYTVTPEAMRWFEQHDRFSRGNSPLGVRAIEVAYGMHRAGLTSLNSPGQLEQAQQALWAGTLDEGIRALTGLQSQYFSSAGMTPSQLAAQFNNPKAQAITAGTSANPPSPLVPSHAYTVTAYDQATNMVTVENPWYTSQPFQVSANSFAYYATTLKP